MHGNQVFKIIILLYTSAFTLGFTLNSRHRLATKDIVYGGRLQMAAAGSGGVEEEELDVVPGAAKFKLDDSQTPSSQQAKNLVRNVEVEQKWRDTEIAANTQFDFTNLSSLFVLIPGILLLNDFFHFLPKEWNII